MRGSRLYSLALLALSAVLLAPSLAMAISSKAESVVFTDSTHGYLSGGYAPKGWPSYGFVSTTSDGGATWKASRFDSWMPGIDVISPLSIWGVGSFSRIAWKSTDGTTWRASAPIGDEYTDLNVSDVVQLDPATAIAVGQELGMEEGDLASIWRTTDAGETWHRAWYGPVFEGVPGEEPIDSWYARLNAVAADKVSNSVFAVGVKDKDANGAPESALFLKSTDGGVSWTKLGVPTNAAYLSTLAVAGTNVWTAMGTQVYRSVAGGSLAVTAASPRFNVYGIAARSDKIAAVAGSYGRVAYTKDGGATWKTYTSPAGLSLNSVAFRDSTHLIAVGDDSYIVRLTIASDGSLASPVVTKASSGHYPAPPTLAMSAPSVSSYASAKMTGRLKSGSSTLYNKAVKVEQSFDNIEWSTLATRYTTSKDSGGYYFSYTAGPTTRRYYRASYADRSYGPVLTVMPKVYLSTPTASTSTMRYGSSYNTYGSLKPKHAAGSYPVKLYAYRYESGRWVYKKSYSAKASDYSTYTRYSYSLKLPYKGSWRIKAYHPADSLNAATYSAYKYITVK